MLDTAASVQTASSEPAAGRQTIAALIRALLRQPLAAQPLPEANFRTWAANVCAAEVEHSKADFWAIVHRLGIVSQFDRNDGVGVHEPPFRLAHEVHAFAALSWLSHLQTLEADKSGPWAATRWNTWDADRRHQWLADRRELWSGFLRQMRRYVEARRDFHTFQEAS